MIYLPHSFKLNKPLSSGEEKRLFQRVRCGDKTAVNDLVFNHARFVLYIARKYRHFGHPLAELFQEGMIGLMEAIRRFNPERNVRLSTYAMWWIRASLQTYVVRSRSLVKVGTNSVQRSIFFHLLHRLKAYPGNSILSDELITSLAQRFNLTAAEVILIAKHIRHLDKSLDGKCQNGSKTPILDTLKCDRPNPEEILIASSEQKHRKARLYAALTLLPPRELTIIKKRFLSETRLSRKNIGVELGLSKERVRQLEIRALSKLRSLIGQDLTKDRDFSKGILPGVHLANS